MWRDWVVILMGIGLGIFLAGYVCWISVQNLKQARLLRLAAWVGTSGLGSDRPAALYGQVRVLRPLRKPSVGDCLWWRVEYQKLYTEGFRKGWRTVHEDVETAQFWTAAAGRSTSATIPPRFC